MAQADGEAAEPTRARAIVAALIVALIVVAIWAVIDYRQKPPPPPNKVGERVSNRGGSKRSVFIGEARTCCLGVFQEPQSSAT